MDSKIQPPERIRKVDEFMSAFNDLLLELKLPADKNAEIHKYLDYGHYDYSNLHSILDILNSLPENSGDESINRLKERLHF